MSHASDGTFYCIEGPPGAPVVALIHGLSLTHEVWDQTTAALSANYQVLRYDLYGHGKSPHPSPWPDLALMARQLAGLLDDLAIPRAAIIGFSLGGMIGRQFAQDFRPRTAALGVLHSPHTRSAKAQAAILARVALAADGGPEATVDLALERWFTERFRLENPDAMARVRGWVLGNDRASYPMYYRILAEDLPAIIAPKPPMACPVLVVTGQDDYGNSPEMARSIARETLGAEMVILPGLRHMAMMEDPSSTNAALDGFLARVYPAHR